jgi:hypothetical protein
MRHAIIGLLMAPMGAQAAAFQLPAGCTAYLTVQENNCQVDHHFRCEGDTAGTQRRVSLSEEGMLFMGQIDTETQWIESFHALSGHTETLVTNSVDPASLTELLETGRDTFDFYTSSAEIGRTRYVGEDNLTGRTVVIDEVTLDETSYSITALSPEGVELWRAKGREFISREWRMFLSGTGVVTTPTDKFERNDTPAEFIFPGEAGFLSTKPKHGCGALMSLAPELQEYSNDHI